MRDVDEDVHCDISAVGLELRDSEDKKGGKEGGEETVLELYQQ